MRNALAAKCRTMKGRLLTFEQYSLLSACPELRAAVEYLKTTEGYSHLLSDVDSAQIHRARLEQLLERGVIDAYAKLYTFTTGVERDFFKLMLEEFTIEYLLDAIRATEYNTSKEFYHIPSFIREHSNIDFGRLFNAASREQILFLLKGSEYFDIIAPRIDGAFEEIEAELICAYYKKLIRSLDKLFEGEERSELLSALHTQIDLKNLSVILRMRRFASLTEQTDRVTIDLTRVLPRLIPCFGRLREADISRLCESAMTTEETIEEYSRIAHSPKDELDEKSSTGEFGSRMLCRISKKLSGRSDLAGALGYLTLLRLEADNLIYILEAIRYEMPHDRIIERIIT